MRRPWIVVALAAAALAGCNGYFYNSGYRPPPPPGQCIVPTGIALAYPEPSATAVPTSATAGYIAVPSAISSPAADNLIYVTTNVQLYGGSLKQVSYGAIPTPNRTPSYSNPVYYESTFNATLSGATKYSVYWNNATSNCVQGSGNFLGSFTTQ